MARSKEEEEETTSTVNSDFNWQEYATAGQDNIPEEAKLYKQKATENLLIANRRRSEGNPHLAAAYDRLHKMHQDIAQAIIDRSKNEIP